MPKYAAAVARQEMAKLSQNPKPPRNSNGNAMNKTREGKTNQKIPWDKAETL